VADTGVFGGNRYFDVLAEYAKHSPNDILIRLTVTNRGPEPAALHLLPTVWFRNSWTWGASHGECETPPRISSDRAGRLVLDHDSLKRYFLEFSPDPAGEPPPVLFTGNDTNFTRLFNAPNLTRYVKDAFHEYVIHGRREAVNPENIGTKAAPYYLLSLGPGESQTIRLRLYAADEAPVHSDVNAFEDVFKWRRREADEFYSTNGMTKLTDVERNIVRQGYAGLLWSKQFYHYVVADWLEGDPRMPEPPAARKHGRNHDWTHLYSHDVLSMPDKWEYPWFAAWDLAFHMVPFARIDGAFAKEQLSLLLREWYMHPNGEVPAYEFAFGDVNPPVHAWAAWRVYKISNHTERRDRDFLESVFQKLLMNFTWWVNRKDPDGKNLFAGGFLGLDNIGVFDRSKSLPDGGTLRQADGTSWMAFYCITMLAISLELARDEGKIRPAFEDMASKFLEHFVQIADAINTLGGTGLWDEADGFYYDQIKIHGKIIPLKTRSVVGLLPIIAVEVLSEEKIKSLPGFYKRYQWFQKYRQDLGKHMTHCESSVHDDRQHCLLAIPTRERLGRILRYLLDENEFLSPFGIRSLSKYHQDHPYIFEAGGATHRVDYEPGESGTGLFGGNSNWRGPVWFPINYLLIEALERYHHFYGDSFKTECPVGSGKMLTLKEVAREISTRLGSLFVPDASGRRPSSGGDPRYSSDPNWKNLVLFHEYFNGDTGKGLGASHQTGWTALVIRLFEDLARRRNHDAGMK
jgi:hypothetical protein